MDIVDWLGSLRRRWVVSICMVLLTLGAVLGVGQLVLPRYEASASLLLLGPNSYPDQEGEEIRVNPYARFGGAGEGVTGTTLIAVLMSPQALREAEAEGFPGEYEVAFAPSGGGAIIDITVTSKSAQDSLAGLDQITATAQRRLVEQQTEAGAPEDSLVEASLLTRSEEAQSLDGAKVRAMAATGALGLVLTLLVVRVLDLRARRRRLPPDAPADRHPDAAPARALTEGAGQSGRETRAGQGVDPRELPTPAVEGVRPHDEQYVPDTRTSSAFEDLLTEDRTLPGRRDRLAGMANRHAGETVRPQASAVTYAAPHEVHGPSGSS